MNYLSSTTCFPHLYAWWKHCRNCRMNTGYLTVCFTPYSKTVKAILE